LLPKDLKRRPAVGCRHHWKAFSFEVGPDQVDDLRVVVYHQD
jgi:hypothetical protein